MLPPAPFLPPLWGPRTPTPGLGTAVCQAAGSCCPSVRAQGWGAAGGGWHRVHRHQVTDLINFVPGGFFFFFLFPKNQRKQNIFLIK